jgi:hypothetical protein
MRLAVIVLVDFIRRVSLREGPNTLQATRCTTQLHDGQRQGRSATWVTRSYNIYAARILRSDDGRNACARYNPLMPLTRRAPELDFTPFESIATSSLQAIVVLELRAVGRIVLLPAIVAAVLEQTARSLQ